MVQLIPLVCIVGGVMARKVKLKRDGLMKTGYVGFSWTTLFFGFFVPIFRGDWFMVMVMLVLNIVAPFLSAIILGFVYNKMYTRGLIEKYGYVPADDYSARLLASEEIYVLNDRKSDISKVSMEKSEYIEENRDEK